MPKKTKGGGSKTANAEDGEMTNLHLDTRPLEPLVLDNDVAKMMQKLDTQVGKCKAGVAWINILALSKRLKFGTYNDRAENETETNKLVTSFRDGIMSMKDQTAIPIIIDIARIKNADSLSKDFLDPGDVPELELVDKDPIVVASGQHRLAALVKFKQQLDDEFNVLAKKRDKFRAMDKISADQMDTYNKVQFDMRVIMGITESVGKWGVVVYNQRKLLAKGNDDLATHLSRNNALPEYGETDEEVIITAFKRMLVAYDAAPEESKRDAATMALVEVRTTGKKNARIQKVLHHEMLCVVLATQLLKLGPHFRRRREFTVTWLFTSIGICMGEATKQLAMLRESMRTCKENEKGDLSTWMEVIGSLNEHAEAVFTGYEDIIEEMTPAYVTTLSIYRGSVIRTLRDMWSLSKKSEDEIKSNDILKSLDRIVARVTLHLTPELGAKHAPEPILGAWMMNYIWEYLIRTQVGIVEICHWFEPLLDHFRRIGGRQHTMDDWSTVMMLNIVKDQRIVEPDADMAVAEIIWTYRKSFVMRLNNVMLNIAPQLPPRPKDKGTFDDAVAKMGENEQVLYQALHNIVMKRKQRNVINPKNIAGEARTIAGIMGLHVTAWDWASPSIKNNTRDLLPTLQAIILERTHMQSYRPKLLSEPWVGALRRLIEMALAQYVQPLQTIGRSGLETTAEWTWWDELTISDKQADPQAIIDTLEDESVQEQHKLEERLTLKQAHTDAIQKLINYVANLPCAKSSSSSDALISADVSIGLEYLLRAVFLNTSRARVREMWDNPNKKFNVSTDVEALDIIFPQCEADKFTTGYDDDYEDPEDHAEMEFKNPRNKGKAKEIQVSDEADVPPTIRQTPASGSKPPVSNVPTTVDGQPRPVPKPRPVPRKTHNAPSTSEVTVHPSSGQHDKDPNVESEASANDQTRSSTPAVATVAHAGDMSVQSGV
ncbi:uncharacterized protein F5891DRAFT_1251064 [Suillus fuscotomentosus]|uniref:Uncharacterized protein n=1 Tax=Suillus fuscotomentosus TaxID=1912939 RepID=A0AAD4HAL9_9AGAM|nr:uncharacterized protein F5891DRAFT_1251064 [Suillus fuscotomentosus]KAG1882287.1 hypothetical protein F5891DRAFT_1251064 [Suillus fuscotomentosus]